jgi:hypothetical protein
MFYYRKVDVNPVTSGTKGFAIYPNPTRDMVSIAFDEPLQDKTAIHVFNQLGMLVKTMQVEKGAQVESIDISGFKNGMYILKISGAEFKIGRLVILK